MRTHILCFLAASAALFAVEPAAELKAGLGIEQMEIKDASDAFKVDPGTKIYVWTKVSGVEGEVKLSFEKDGKAVFQKDLEVPHSPYRTNAFRTFRAGDDGNWTVKALDKDGKEVGSTSFKVEVK
jgi:hypothetical protein